MTRPLDEIRDDLQRERDQLARSTSRLQEELERSLHVRSLLRARTLVGALGAVVALLLVSGAVRLALGALVRRGARALHARAA